LFLQVSCRHSKLPSNIAHLGKLHSASASNRHSITSGLGHHCTEKSTPNHVSRVYPELVIMQKINSFYFLLMLAFLTLVTSSPAANPVQESSHSAISVEARNSCQCLQPGRWCGSRTAQHKLSGTCAPNTLYQCGKPFVSIDCTQTQEFCRPALVKSPKGDHCALLG
jgi:hypothetical protein